MPETIPTGRREGRRPPPRAKGRPEAPPASPEARNPDGGWRSWFEALVMAFVLAMFVRTFIFELFKIPTGSMIPTLIGGQVADLDVTGDGRDDLVVFQAPESVLVFEGRKGGYEPLGPRYVPPADLREWMRQSKPRTQHDRILVNKFAYWFRAPSRGDVVVFKVPDLIWDPAKPMYIKRAVGLPGDTLEFDPQCHVLWNSDPQTPRPEFFAEHAYISELDDSMQLHRFPYVEYAQVTPRRLQIKKVHVPEEMIYVMGDNAHSSLDGRYWGGVELNRLKGKAFFRYWPLLQAKFIH